MHVQAKYMCCTGPGLNNTTDLMLQKFQVQGFLTLLCVGARAPESPSPLA